MPTNYKILGQVASNTDVTLNVYTVPANTEAVISTIVVCNRGGANSNYTIAAQANGDAIADQHYLAYNSLVQSNDSIALTLGITLSASDVLSVNASSNTVTFSVFGSEIS